MACTTFYCRHCDWVQNRRVGSIAHDAICDLCGRRMEIENDEQPTPYPGDLPEEKDDPDEID